MDGVHILKISTAQVCLEIFYSTNLITNASIEIKDFIQKLGLVFCGFEDNRIVSLFQKDNKLNSDLYEEQFSLKDIFSGIKKVKLYHIFEY